MIYIEESRYLIDESTVTHLVFLADCFAWKLTSSP